MEDVISPVVWSVWHPLPDQGPSLWWDVYQALRPFAHRAQGPANDSVFEIECSESDFPKIFAKLTREGLQCVAECRTIVV